MSRIALYGGAAALGAVVLYVLAKKKSGESLAGSAGRAAATAVGDAAVGAVKGIGSVFGIPDTSLTQCEKDIAAGRTWDASFSCPAGRFVGSIFNSTAARDAEVNDARQIDRIIERQQKSVAGLSGVYDPATGETIAYFDEMGNRVY